MITFLVLCGGKTAIKADVLYKLYLASLVSKSHLLFNFFLAVDTLHLHGL